jgi:hypothetical protein
MPPSNEIASEDIVWKLAVEPQEVILQSRTEGEPLAEAKHLVIRGKGYDSDSAARKAGLSWSSIVKAAFAAQHLAADFGDRAPQSFFTKQGLALWGENAGRPVLNDVHGIMTYESDPRLMLVGVDPIHAIRGAQGNRLLATLQRAVQLNCHLSPAEHLAYDLFSGASLVEDSADAKFMMLMMALETLIDQKDRSEKVKLFVDDLKKQTLASELPSNEKDSLSKSLESLVRESVGRAGRRLARTLGDRRYMNQKPVAFFNQCYEMRNALAHGYLDRPSRDAVAALGSGLELFVADLIAGSLVGFGQAFAEFS